MLLRTFLLIAALVGASPTLHAQDHPIGAWENLTRGDLVGLELKDTENCNLYLERALGKRTDRRCRYEPFEDRYLIFLYNEQGVCNSDADFEFIYEPEAPLVRLVIAGSEVALQKVSQQE